MGSNPSSQGLVPSAIATKLQRHSHLGISNCPSKHAEVIPNHTKCEAATGGFALGMAWCETITSPSHFINLKKKLNGNKTFSETPLKAVPRIFYPPDDFFLSKIPIVQTKSKGGGVVK